MKYLALFLMFFSIEAFATAVKVMVEEPVYDANCVMGANDDVNRTAQTITEIGTITTGDCNSAWTSGVNFSNGYRGVRLGRVATACDKQIYFQLNTSTVPGKNGTLSDWATVSDGANPCIHTDGKQYHKYTAVKP